MEQILINKNGSINWIFLFVILITSFSCSRSSNNESKLDDERKALELYNKSLARFQDFLLVDQTITSTSILDTLNLAIKLNPNNSQYYYTKSTVHKAFGDLDSAIYVLDELYLVDSLQISAVSLSGYYYEFIGDKVRSDSLYKLALKKYQLYDSIIEYEFGDLEDWAYLNTFVHGKDSTLNVIIGTMTLSDSWRKELENRILKFDREIYIQDIGNY